MPEYPHPPIFRNNFGFFQLAFRTMVRCFAPRFRVTGRKHIPYRGPIILAPAHRSDVDPPVIGAAILRRVTWLAKRELWEIGWLGKVLDFVGSFPVDPLSPDRSALKRSREILDMGEALVIFPEGKISPTGELLPLLPGAVMLALQSGAPVIPVGLYGSNHIVPYGSTIPRPTLKKVRVHFGPVLRFDDLKGLPARQARTEALERLEAALRKAQAIAES